MIIPQKINLAHLPTPLQSIKFDGCKFLLKRDDLTGLELSGNKVRKLEYLLADAKKKKTDLILTVGGNQSNHCRATAIAASSLGIRSKLYLWGKINVKPEGNLFLNSILDNQIKMLSKEEFIKSSQLLENEKKRYLQEGKNVYIIPEGGTNGLGIWGYISFFDELKNQIVLDRISGIAVSAGSGGTAAGLLLGAALNKSKIKIYAVNVLYDKITLLNKIKTAIEECILSYKLNVSVDYNSLEIIDGFMGENYHKPTIESLELAKRVFNETTILFDPVYTSKAFLAYHKNFIKNKKSTKVMFLHTGGIFGIFDKKRLAYL